MSRYVVRRLAQALVGLAAILLLTFLVVHLAPGDPVDALVGEEPPNPEYADLLRRQLGLDQPIQVQLARWLKSVARGDLGVSYTFGTPVLTVIGRKVVPTLVITGTAFVLSSAAGVFAGLAAARRRGRLFDRLTGGATLLGYSVPSFWLAHVAILVFAFKLQILPSGGSTSYRYSYDGWQHFVDVARHAVLPIGVLFVSELALLTRVTRSSIVSGADSGYARTALAKGLAPELVVSRHVLRNSLLPVVTVIGQRVGFLLSGAVIVEVAFGWPGLGATIVGAAISNDRPLMLGIVLVLAASVTLANLAADLVYAWADPRLRRP